MVAQALDYVSRSECHDALQDYTGSDKWRGVALRQFSAIRKGYATYLSSPEGIKENNLITSVEEEVRSLCDKNKDKISEEESHAPASKKWLETLRGPAAMVQVPQFDWIKLVSPSERTTTRNTR